MKKLIILTSILIAQNSLAVDPAANYGDSNFDTEANTVLRCENLPIPGYSTLEIVEQIQKGFKIFKIYLKNEDESKKRIISSGYLKEGQTVMKKPFFSGNLAVPGQKVIYQLTNYKGYAPAYKTDYWVLNKIGAQITEEEQRNYPKAYNFWNSSPKEKKVYFPGMNCTEYR